jgi:L-asparaginase/beta-aspartyl-peptidase (threonine type)
LGAAVTAVTQLEDDGRFNAGSGSVLCMDGLTVEMDAGVMDSLGRLGAVACIEHVRNPVQVARAVAQSPHWLLAGQGATQFARKLGHPQGAPISARQRQKHAEMLAKLQQGAPLLPGVDPCSFSRLWNYPASPVPAIGQACDTVGAVVRAQDGSFAVACSTGGSAPSLLGRVGDTPVIGSGYFAGPVGAVAATGIGEHIVRRLLSYTVYLWLADGLPMQQALERGLRLFPDEIDIGLIAVTRTEQAAISNRNMPAAVRTGPA